MSEKKETISKSRKLLIRYIHENIDNILIEDRKYILNMVVDVVEIDNIFEEGTGIRMLYSKIPKYLLLDIKDHIIISMRKTKLNLSSDEE